jgi:hypothetical protein
MSTQKIGRYDIVRELGRGGMAIVYLGYDPNIKRQVAIKLLPRQFTFDPQFRARFQREAEVIAALEHPFIVPVHDFGGLDDQPYIVMRYMPGGSLLDRLRVGSVSLTDLSRIVSRLGEALDLAHSQKIIHRDLKPGNILFDGRGEAYLSDFGIAKISEATAALTGTGMIGTPEYMSPDQAKGVKELDGRSDVYSLGVVVFQALTSQLPFKADTPMSLALAHITQPIPSIRSLKPELPAGVEPIIARAMAKEPSQRYPTAGELARDLQRVAELPTAPPDYTVVEPWTQGATTVEPWTPGVTAPPPPPGITAPPPPAGAVAGVPPTSAPRMPLTAQAPPQPARSGPPWMAIAGIGGGALLLGLCCVAIIASQAMDIPFFGGPTETPTFVFVPTDTPDLRPTPTAPAASETPAPTDTADVIDITQPPPASGGGVGAPGASWPEVLADDFESDKDLWPAESDTDEFGTIARSITGGKYIWDISAAQGVVSNARPEMDFISDFYASVEARQVSGVEGGEYGIVFRHDGTNYYLFIVSELQEYAFFLRNNGEWTTLIDWTDTNAVQPGQPNHIAVRAEGASFSLYINGQPVGSATDSALSSGEVGMAAQLYDAGDTAQFEFDNFQLHQAWPVALADTFDGAGNGWPVGSFEDERVNAERFIDGKYRFQVAATDGFVWRLSPDLGSVTDFHLTVEAQRVSGPIESPYGLAFRDDGDNYYYFKISDDGYYRVALYFNGEWQTVIDWTTTDAVVSGGVNRLAVLAQGSTMKFYINDRFMAQADDGRVGSGEVGVALELNNGGESGTFEYDNFEVRTP